MECKKCKAQLEPGVTVCPECGTDNTAEAPKGIVLTPGKLVAIVAAVVLLTAVVVGLAIAAPSLKKWAQFRRRKAAARKEEEVC